MKKVLLMGGTGLVGRAMDHSLRDAYRVVVTAGHHDVDGGWKLTAEEPERLLPILEAEDPDIVISSIRGDFQAQLRFHAVLADWLAGKDKRLLFISTANVFDGDLSRPWTEADPPVPKSDYGVYKRDCEAMLREKLPGQVIIFRLAAVWAPECPRLRRLKEGSRTGETVQTYQGDAVNISLAEQIGWYARYVLDHDLTGVFHVGTTDTVDYYEFEKMVCETLNIRLPEFEVTPIGGNAVQAVVPARREIPQNLQLTVAQVLQRLAEQL
ncbi:MAG: sugar nucleotide-binding protein [Candidatus Enterenecus sp.]